MKRGVQPFFVRFQRGGNWDADSRGWRGDYAAGDEKNIKPKKSGRVYY